MSMRRLSCLAVAIAAAIMPPSAPAVAQGGAYTAEGFRAYLPALRAQALAAGVSRATIDRIFPTLSFSARTIELDRAQPGGAAGSPAIPPFAPYQQRHVTPDLIARGASRYVANRAQLNDIARRYGVTPSSISSRYAEIRSALGLLPADPRYCVQMRG